VIWIRPVPVMAMPPRRTNLASDDSIVPQWCRNGTGSGVGGGDPSIMI
jgi:hypothetical protein